MSAAGHKPFRHKLPDERASLTHKFTIAGHEGYFMVGLYPDGKPGELFITMSKQGSSMSGLCDTIAMLFSLCLQYNVPLDVLVEKLEHMHFDPAGFTNNKDIGPVSSISDYIAKFMKLKFGPPEIRFPKDEFSGGRPVAEAEPPLQPWEDTGDLEVRHNSKTGWKDKTGVINPPEPTPSVDPLQQAIELGSGLTAPMDPTKKEPERAKEEDPEPPT